MRNMGPTRRLLSLLTLAALGLGGCTAVWGQPHKVEFASSSSITLTFDPAFTNMGEVQNTAQEHCAKYEKDALPGKDKTSPWGLVTISFNCKKRIL